jgi:aryl-alcohol dehydrogenase-like predicted oxidoreductase
MDHHLAMRIPLGASDLQVSPIGVGTNAWGSQGQTDPQIRDVIAAALEAGINLFDTAEIYNFGRSERTVGKILPGVGRPVVVTTKFLPLPWRLGKAAMKRALQGSLARLGLERVDLYLIHFPWPPVPLETWVEGLAEAKEAGLVRAVGVSNCSADQTRRAQAVLARHGMPLACNQVEYNLLKRDVERNGVLAACRELDVTLVAYRPFASGYLTGKYKPQEKPGGPRRWMYREDTFTRIQPLIARMRQIGEAHGGKSPSQVALNWLICKGVLPIPGATKVSHIQENAGALGWQLTTDDLAAVENN